MCPECEHRLGDAENYALPMLRQNETSFPLLEKLGATKPLGSGRSGSSVYSAPSAGIDIEKFAYFALSMFWRASVHVWKTLNGQTISMLLRSNEEPIRKYLNEESGFPGGVVLKVSVCTDNGSRFLRPLSGRTTCIPATRWLSWAHISRWSLALNCQQKNGTYAASTPIKGLFSLRIAPKRPVTIIAIFASEPGLQRTSSP